MDLDVQYDPKKEIEGANFGGINFNLPKKAKTVKVLDDIESVKIESKIRKFQGANEIETGREVYQH